MKYLSIPDIKFFFDPDTQRVFSTFSIKKDGKQRYITIIFTKSLYLETNIPELSEEHSVNFVKSVQLDAL